MELFSKRNKTSRLNRPHYLREGEDNPKGFLKESTRKRLQEEIKYIVESNQYLERFIVVHLKKDDRYCLESDTLKQLTMRTLGYDINKILKTKSFDFDTPEYNDIYFFDLIEIIVIFSKKDKRDDVVNRLQDILKEEKTSFVFYDFMIFSRDTSGLRSIVPLIKNQKLKTELEQFFSEFGISSNYETGARKSAQILSLVFSSPNSKKDTKKYTEDMCKNISKRITDKEHQVAFASLLSDTIKNAKELNNQISNIRHIENYTIPVDSPNFFKLVTNKNIGLIELAILSRPEDYVTSKDPEEIKQYYLKQYNVSPLTEWYIGPNKPEDEIDPDDIPF